jgi:hypothetical protein
MLNNSRGQQTSGGPPSCGIGLGKQGSKEDRKKKDLETHQHILFSLKLEPVTFPIQVEFNFKQLT